VLIIHVGLHKTGSTAIQAALSDMTRSELSGIAYMGSHSPADNDGFMSNGSANEEPGFVVPTHIESRGTATDRMLADGRTVVLSSEGFLGSMQNLYPDARGKAQDMRKYFASRTDLRVVIYLRPQHTWLESVYTQVIQEGGSDKIEDFTQVCLQQRYFRFANLVADLKHELGSQRVIVRAYHPGVDVVTDFLSILGVPRPNRFKRAPRPNKSITPAQVGLMRLINETATPAESWALRYFFQNWLMDSGDNTVSKTASVLPPDIQKELRAFTLTDWQELKGEIKDTLLPSTDVFDQVIEQARDEHQKLYIKSDWETPAISSEAAKSLRFACTQLSPKNKPLTNLLRAMEQKARNDPGGLPRAGYRRIIRYLSARRQSGRNTHL
jgi:hypothetical protein